MNHDRTDSIRLPATEPRCEPSSVCALRDLAQGPMFFASLRCGKLTPEYKAALAPLGEDLAAVHAEVRAVAKTLKTGAIPA